MTNPQDCDFMFKVLVVGDSGCGKSSITIRLSEDVFFTDYASTIAIDFRMHLMRYKGFVARLNVWDTAGQERFSSVTASFYRGANGVLLCFDITNRQSFEHCSNWLDRIKMQAMPGVPIILVGCKLDEARNRAVNENEAAAWARSHGMGYLETSAKTKDNVIAAFESITERMIEDASTRSKNVTGSNNGPVAGSVSLAQPPNRPGGPGTKRGGAAAQSEGGCPC